MLVMRGNVCTCECDSDYGAGSDRNKENGREDESVVSGLGRRGSWKLLEGVWVT